MKQTGHINAGEKLSLERLNELFAKRFDSINYEQAKRDVLPFIKDSVKTDIWSTDFFKAVTAEKLSVK